MESGIPGPPAELWEHDRDMAETREPGWYADPWGTEDERYFDGSAWTRQVRPPSAQSGETPGENECKGMRKCHVPLNKKAWPKARKRFEELMAKEDKKVGPAPKE